MLHWKCDDLFVLPELEDLEKCLRGDYNFETEIFSIPSENAHLELMLKIGDMIKKHESDDTLFVVYYGGHARIDESRQSTWCATRRAGSPWLQWSAIQTLLERSMSDVLILLDCCAGAASATFPTGQSITETISASSWDAIAPDPGRYSFTNALIEVLQEWRQKTFSAAMLHAEVLARLKHPRPILINGKHFEARSTPVHFMMTSNYKAPSIELGRLVPNTRQPQSPPNEIPYHYHSTTEPRLIQGRPQLPGRAPAADNLIPITTEPNENEPHVMISLALEDDQQLDLSAWEEWLASFPAIAKYVKVQGVFKSHSTLLLLSLPVTVWDLLPDDPACSFVAFIRSNNLLASRTTEVISPEPEVAAASDPLAHKTTNSDTASLESEKTFTPTEDSDSGKNEELARPSTDWNSVMSDFQRQILPIPRWIPATSGATGSAGDDRPRPDAFTTPFGSTRSLPQPSSNSLRIHPRSFTPVTPWNMLERLQTAPPTVEDPDDFDGPTLSGTIPTSLMNQTRRSRTMTFATDDDIPEGPRLAKHVVNRLEQYFQKEPEPNLAVTELLASNLGIETSDVHLWLHHRRQQELMRYHLQGLKLGDYDPKVKDGARMILPGHLNTLLQIYPSKSVLIIDLRSSTDFEKSHIHEAINLRAPLSFVQYTSLEMIEDTLVDDHSRRSFSKWMQSKCVVFYDRVIEFDWECPVADALYEKFTRKGWRGQCFILKGHYREFSASFEKYISGSKMSKEAKEYLDGLRQQSSPAEEEASRQNNLYESWLRAFESEDRVPVSELIPAKKLDRIRALEQRQKELEAEFETRFPALYRKAQALKPVSNSLSPSRASSYRAPPPPFTPAPVEERKWGFGEVRWNNDADNDSIFDRKAQLVEPLASGLNKMREADGLGTATPTMAAADKLDTGYADDYDEIDPKMEGLKNDPLFQRAGTTAAKVQDSGSGGGIGAADDLKKGAKKRPQIWERLRSGK
ncbi:hypothetical protein B0T22DRAFT_370548 [Podospora appendiculata]|uniref:Homeobox domain-containing protein n=1 Tax=Podospora appendiculata TaxID=314037 RepID=A0AAE1CFT6_9PEZI|nr:hypothetical protein B0T22DRAFT_370548 [Podospora appendiculata]